MICAAHQGSEDAAARARAREDLIMMRFMRHLNGACSMVLLHTPETRTAEGCRNADTLGRQRWMALAPPQATAALHPDRSNTV